jgi:hypothetical protein
MPPNANLKFGDQITFLVHWYIADKFDEGTTYTFIGPMKILDELKHVSSHPIYMFKEFK